MLVKWIVKVFLVINANKRPGEVASGLALGFVMALQPGFTVFRIVVMGLLFLLKVHLPSALLGLFLFSFAAPLFDPLLDGVGGWILTMPPLRVFWSYLYSIPLVPLTGFNNTIRMGGLAVGIILAVPVYFLCRILIHQYRSHWRDAIAELPMVKSIGKIPLVASLGRFLRKFFGATEGVL